MTKSAYAHGGGTEEHLNIGYYYGHDGSYENPANPPQPATLLVDTHPWELGAVFIDLAPVNSAFLQGHLSEIPGFETLSVDDQEFGGHGFYSWLDPGYSHGDVNVILHLDAATPGLQILNSATLQSQALPMTLGSDFSPHVLFFVDQSLAPGLGTLYTATFHLTDSLGSLADSEPFTLQFQVAPEPSTLGLLGCVASASVLRRRRAV
jgi:hypothetical protein